MQSGSTIKDPNINPPPAIRIALLLRHPETPTSHRSTAMSLFASDYSPVATPTSPAKSDSTSRKGKSINLGPDGEKHEEPISNIDKLTGLPTPPRSPPSDAAPDMGRHDSDGSGSGSIGSGSGSGGATVQSLDTGSAGTSATVLELVSDPLDRPYVAAKKANGYNTYEGCMEGESP